jgi:integrase
MGHGAHDRLEEAMRRRNEQGSIVTRVQGRKYLIRWTTPDGQRLGEIVKGDYVEAQAALVRKLRPTNEKPVRTFKSFAETEFAAYTKREWKKSTQITQGSFLSKHIRPFFDDMELAKILPRDIEAFHRALEAKKLAPKTRRTIHAILGTMFYYAAETLEIIGKSPVKRDFAPKVEAHEKAALSPEQAWQLWDALAGPGTIRNRAFYGVLLFTGIRTGEGLGLKWADLDFAEKKLYVRRAISRGGETTPKTKKSLRVRPMPDHLFAALRNHKVMAHYVAPQDYVFASSTGRPANADDLRTALQKVLRENLKIVLPLREDGLHLLRHTSGSLVFGATGSVKEAQEWLGHSSARVTLDTYVHRQVESQNRTADVTFTRPAAPSSEGWTN